MFDPGGRKPGSASSKDSAKKKPGRTRGGDDPIIHTVATTRIAVSNGMLFIAACDRICVFVLSYLRV